MKNIFKKDKTDDDSQYHYTPKKDHTWILQIVRLIAIVVFVYALYSIIVWQIDNNNNNKMMDEIYSLVDFNNLIQVEDGDDSTEDLLDFTKLLKKNSSTVAWVTVNGTSIDYPVVQHENNKYYLTHSFDKSKNSAGWIFLDCDTSSDFSDKNTVIYGHNRRNGTMFSTLKNILKKDWYTDEDNQIITVYTPEKTLKYQVFSVYKIKAETYYVTNNFDSDGDFSKFLKKITERSTYDFGVDVTNSDKILTLSTCADNTSYRIVLHAKLIN